jgi:predicted O-linked N-acetylglucosamine transferase (SPINDLY family)
MNRKQRRAQMKQEQRQALPAALPAPLRDVLANALRHHQAGRLAEAERLYREVLTAHPRHPDTLHFLGVALAAQGKFAEAVASYDRALAIRPNHAEAHYNRGLTLAAMGRRADAIASYDRAITLSPEMAEAHNNRGNELRAQGQLDQAIRSYQRTIAINPNLAETFNNLGIAYTDQGKLDEAVASFDRALALKPGFAEAHNNRGNALKNKGSLAEAMTAYERALALKPAFAEAHVNRGDVLGNRRQFDEALASYDRALALKPDLAGAHGNRGVLLAGQGKVDEAVASFDRALALEPGSLKYAWMSKLWLPIILPADNDAAAHRERYRQSIAALKESSGVLTAADALHLPSMFHLAYDSVDDRATLEELAGLYRAKWPTVTFEAPHVRNWRPPQGDRRLRIGFLSEFFWDHTIGKLYRGLIRHLDRSRFEIVLIHAPQAQRDSMADQLDALADRSLRLAPSLALQQQAVAEQQLDALFYPDVGMSRDTYLLAYARLAPVQAVSWGHPNTTGSNTLDYFVSAESIEPTDADLLYSERLIRMSRLPCTYEPPADAPDSTTRADFGLPESGTLYGCPQSLFKFHPEFDAILAEIAAGDPQGHIVVIDGAQPALNDLLRRRWQRNQPSLVDRVRFLPRMTRERFLALMVHFDVLLDPIHFGSGNTLYEAMVRGTPIVTWPGRFMRGRIVAAAYRQMGIVEAPIARRLADYAPLALALGRDPARREALRQASLAAAKRNLFDDRQAVTDFEAFVAAAIDAAGRKTKLAAGWRPPLPCREPVTLLTEGASFLSS